LQPKKQRGGGDLRESKVTHNAVELAPFAAGRVEAGGARGTERLALPPRVSGADDGGYDDEQDA
jgi:hypothetical protein